MSAVEFESSSALISGGDSGPGQEAVDAWTQSGRKSIKKVTATAESYAASLTDIFVLAKLSVVDFVEVRDAARRLGVTTRQVQHLAAEGELLVVARGVIDRVSLDHYLATRQGSRRRAWSEATAWGAVAILSGRSASWMGQSQRSRLKTRLRNLAAADVVGRARNRARVHRYEGHARTAERLHAEVIDTARAARLLGLLDTADVDGYLAVRDLAGVVERHGLTEAADGRYTLRATTMDLAVVRDLAEGESVLAAVDLAESLDVRERQAGLDYLNTTLERLRD